MSRCRICLKTSPVVRCLKGNAGRMVCDILQISISASDRFPKKICQKCHSVVLSTHKLRILAAKSYSILLSEEYADNDSNCVNDDVANAMEFEVSNSDDITVKEECLSEHAFDDEAETEDVANIEFVDTACTQEPCNINKTDEPEDKKDIDRVESSNIPDADDIPLAEFNVDVCKLPQTEKEAIPFLQTRGILPIKMMCRNQHDMILYIREGRRNVWQCNKRTCRNSVNTRDGTWFSTTKLQFHRIIQFIYLWSHELSNVKHCESKLKLSLETTINWSNSLREVCMKYIEVRGSQKIGGVGKVVEVFESLLSNSKRKNHVGQIFPPQYMFGGICGASGECFVVQVPNRSFDTLSKIIKERITEGTTIFSDSWQTKLITELEKESYHRFIANHNYTFFASSTGVHTENTEKLSGFLEWHNKKHRGTVRHHLPSYFAEFMWRHMVRNSDPFEEILSAIGQLWPPRQFVSDQETYS